jgi:uncharacterized protein
MKKLLLLILLVCCTNLALAQMPEMTLTMRGQRIIAEVASTDSERSTGLMHRRMLPENRGMLFVFPESALHGMWMMNTYVPLSVAFIDERGVIINIEDMQPHTQSSHMAARPAKYALEATLGWYRKHGVKPGDKVEGLQQAPVAH